MVPYFIILVFQLTLSAKKNSKILFYISFIVLFIFMGFRGYEVGTDVKQYQNDFDIYKTSGMVFAVEPLWYLLNRFVIFLGGGFREVLLLSSFLVLLPVYFCSKRWSSFPFFSIFFYIGLYFFCNSFNAIRQAISISIGLLGILYYEKNENIKNTRAISLLIVSFLFHYSSIVLPLGFFFSKILKNNSRYLLFFVLASFFIGSFLADFLLVLATRITNYNIGLLNIWGNMAVALSLNLLFLFISNIIKVKDQHFYIFTTFIIFSNLLMRIPFGYRMVMGLGLIQILLLPNLIGNNRLDKSSRKLMVLLFVLYALFTFTLYLSINFSNVIPYNNILF